MTTTVIYSVSLWADLFIQLRFDPVRASGPSADLDGFALFFSFGRDR